MIPRYSRPEMARIWEADTRFRIWFEIEAHAASAMADIGVIPREAASKIWEKGANAKFDVAFLNAELKRAERPVLAPDRATCTLIMAQKRFPGAPASLDALCRRFGVDNSVRTKHGAIVDSELLAEVYLHLIGGRQVGLELAVPTRRGIVQGAGPVAPRPSRPHAPSEAELAAHVALLAKLDDPIWFH